MGDTAYIFAPENCDFCKMEGLEVQAQYDGKTLHGPWAYMCESHFEVMGIGLGTGRGQKLIVGERPTADQSDADIEEIDAATPEEQKPELPVTEKGTTKYPEDNSPRSKMTSMMEWPDLWP